MRRDHRVRFADGRDVHRPAVPAERARLRHAGGRHLDPPGCGAPHGLRGAKIRQADRDTWRSTSHCSSGYAFCLLGFLTMLLLWQDASGTGSRPRVRVHRDGCRVRGDTRIALADRFGAGERSGMASATADLQRDLGGAIMQSMLGALLTAGYAAAFSSRSPDHRMRAGEHERPVELTNRSQARPTPPRSTRSTRQDHRGSPTSFIDGADWAYSGARRDPARGAWCSSSSRSTTSEHELLASTTPRTPTTPLSS